MRLLGLGICLLAGSMSAVGCSKKLHDERDESLTSVDVRTLRVEPVSREQEVRVQITSKGKLHVHCFLEKNKDEAEKAILAKKKSAKVLASKEDTESADLKITVPANEALSVRLTTNKKAEAKVKITN